MSELGDQTVELVPNLTRTDEDIKGAVTEWLRDPAAAEARYSHISLWDTSAVTNMRGLFSSYRYGSVVNIWNFNEDLSAWITTNVTDLSFMFINARSFDCDISAWDTSSVTSLSFTFNGATSFNCGGGDLGIWNTAAVTNMYSTFCNATSFNCDISAWDTSSVITLSYTFHGARSFNCGGGDLGIWNTAAVTNMYHTFDGATSFSCAIGGWHTASVTDMRSMFLGATSFQGDINEWDITSVREPVEDGDPGGMHEVFADGCPVDFTAVWEEHKADPVWQDIWRQRREQVQLEREAREEERRLQRIRDENWERRREWMMIISPYLRRQALVDGPLQRMIDVQGLIQLITSFL